MVLFFSSRTYELICKQMFKIFFLEDEIDLQKKEKSLSKVRDFQLYYGKFEDFIGKRLHSNITATFEYS